MVESAVTGSLPLIIQDSNGCVIWIRSASSIIMRLLTLRGKKKFR